MHFSDALLIGHDSLKIKLKSENSTAFLIVCLHICFSQLTLNPGLSGPIKKLRKNCIIKKWAENYLNNLKIVEKCKFSVKKTAKIHIEQIFIFFKITQMKFNTQ